MPLKRLFGSIVAAVLLSGCSDAPILIEEGRSFQPIMNGKLDPGHIAVGLLRVTHPAHGNLCTATLVGSKTVLTAAHCVLDYKQWPFKRASKVEFYINGKYSNGYYSGDKHEVASFDYHPQYQPSKNTNPPVADIAVVRLTQPVKGVAPMRVAPNPTFVGEQLTIVGYGRTNHNTDDAGTKRVGKNQVSKLHSHYFEHTGALGNMSSICSGDSGGPAFAVRGAEEVLVGVHSAGSTDGPASIVAIEMRLDTYYGWIDTQAKGDLLKAGSPVPPATKDTTPPKVIIQSPADKAQLPTTFGIVATAQDSGGIKMVELFIDGKRVIAKKATQLQYTVSNSQPGLHQIRVEALDNAGNRGSRSVSVHVTKNVSSAGFGSYCAAPQDCQSGLCARDPATGGQYCTQSCNLSQDSCPQGTVCQDAGGKTACFILHDNGGDPLKPHSGVIQGGCSISSVADPNSIWPLALLLAGWLVLLRFRRHATGATGALPATRAEHIWRNEWRTRR